MFTGNKYCIASLACVLKTIKYSSHQDYYQSMHAIADKIILSTKTKQQFMRHTKLIPVVQPTYEEEVLHAAVHKIPKTISAKL